MVCLAWTAVRAALGEVVHGSIELVSHLIAEQVVFFWERRGGLLPEFGSRLHCRRMRQFKPCMCCPPVLCDMKLPDAFIQVRHAEIPDGIPVSVEFIRGQALVDSHIPDFKFSVGRHQVPQ